MKKDIKTSWFRLIGGELSKDAHIILKSLHQDGALSPLDLAWSSRENTMIILENLIGWVEYIEDCEYSSPSGYFILTEEGKQICKALYEK